MVSLLSQMFPLSYFVEFELLCPAGVLYSQFTKSVLGVGRLVVAFLARSLLRLDAVFVRLLLIVVL